MEELKRQFQAHLDEDRRVQESIHSTLRDIQEAQRLVNVNHLPHIEANVGLLAKSFTDHQLDVAKREAEKGIAMAKISTDAEWTKKIMFAVLTVAIAGVGGLFFSLFGKG